MPPQTLEICSEVNRTVIDHARKKDLCNQGCRKKKDPRRQRGRVDPDTFAAG